jgi:hypothetical protein
MAIKKIDQANWASYFDAFSRNLIRSRRSDYAEIRVFSMEDGAQPETAWLPLAGITYDAKGDLLEIQVTNLDHLILHPAEIYVDEAGAGVIASLEIVRQDGVKEIIELR